MCARRSHLDFISRLVKMSPQMKRRLPGLDGLRAVSILLVVMGHSMHAPGFPAWLEWPRVWEAGLGVTIFFALSGYLITGLLLTEEEQNGGIDLRGFYVRRALRILPAAFAFLACLSILSILWPTPLLTVGDVAPALFFCRNIFREGSPFTLHFWSLSIEEQFYLIWPASMMFCRRSWLLPVAVGWLIFEPVWLQLNSLVLKNGFNDWRLDIRLGAILTGVVVALVENDAKCDRIVRWLSMRSAYVFAFGALSLIGRAACNSSSHLVNIGFGYLGDVAIASILFGAVYGPGRSAAAVLNSRPMRLVGRLSYSIYLWQQPFTTPDGWHGQVPRIAQFPLLLIPIILFACASYWLVEKPMLRVRDRWLLAPLSAPIPKESG